MPDRTFFYAPVQVEQGEVFTLDNSQYNHVVNVLRVPVNSSIEVVNGSGLIIQANIIKIDNRRVVCRATEIAHSENELPVTVTLAVALIKQQRYEWMVEKATELGVSRIQPLFTERVVRTGLRLDRLEKKAMAAMKQAERAVLPDIESPQSLEQFLSAIPSENTFIAAQELDNATILDLFTHTHITDAFILIGPEGGWSQEELARFTRMKLQCFRLGRRRLRTETAAIAAINQLSMVVESGRINT